jgi:hypothetical protein
MKVADILIAGLPDDHPGRIRTCRVQLDSICYQYVTIVSKAPVVDHKLFVESEHISLHHLHRCV